MPKKDYYAQLSLSQKAELFKIYAGNGMYSLSDIINHYNSEMDRAYDSKDKDMVARMEDLNAPYLTDEKGNKMTHKMASSDNFVFPTIQRDSNGNLVDHGEDEDWGKYDAIANNDTLRFNTPGLADYFARNYKTHLDNEIMHSDGGDIHIKKSHEGLFTNKANSAGMGVQEYAKHVLANREDFSSTTINQANFAKNAAGWKHDFGGNLFEIGGLYQDNNSTLDKVVGKVKDTLGLTKLPEMPETPYEWTNEDIYNLAKAFESKSPQAYIGVKGDVLGGYGHKLTDAEKLKYWNKYTGKPIGKIDEKTINDWLKADMQVAFDNVSRWYGDDLPSNVRAALVSLRYQGGDKLIRGMRDDNGNIVEGKWSPKLEENIKSYLKNQTKEGLDKIIDEMQYRDDGQDNLSGLSSRYGLYRAIMENRANPADVFKYKNEGTFKLYKSNKIKK